MRHLFLVTLLACKGTPTVPPVMDNDGDGYTAETDCDDDNDQVFPGAVDLAHDDVDADCDGRDGSEMFLRDLPITVSGPVAGDSFGSGFTICDLTGDGQDDLLVSRPGGGVVSRMHVFPGPLEANDLVTLTAAFDVELDSSGIASVHCEDIDGDGRNDLIAMRRAGSGTAGGPTIWYQPAGGFSADLTGDDAASVDIPSDIDEQGGPVAIGDFDGDGAAEIVVGRGSEVAGTDDLYVIPGALYTGANDVADVGTAITTAWGAVYWLSRLNDVDGDGDPELAVCGDVAPLCRIVFDLTGGDFDANVQHEIIAQVAGNFATGDFDGDGDVDDLAMKPFNSEIFNVQIDALSAREIGMVSPDANQLRFPDSGVGTLVNVGDFDGDGVEDVAVAATDRDFMGAQYRVFSGALSADPPAQGSASVALLSAKQDGPSQTGVATGDLDDGDGQPDVLFGGEALEIDGLIGGWLSSGITHP